MKNLLTKTLFILFLLSAVIPSGVQAGDVNKAEKLIREVRVAESRAHEKHATGDSAAIAVTREATIKRVEATIKTVRIIMGSLGRAIVTVEKAIELAEKEEPQRDFTETIVPIYVLSGSARREVEEAYFEAAEEGDAVKREVAHKTGVKALKFAQGIVALAVKIREATTAEAGSETYKKALKSARKAAEEADEVLTAEAEKLYKKTQK